MFSYIPLCKINVYLFQIKSRVLIMCHHFVAGLGFYLGPVMIKSYFPKDEADTDELCLGKENLNQVSKAVVNLERPFEFIFYGHILCCIGYVIVMFVPWEMPGKKYLAFSSSLKYENF